MLNVSKIFLKFCNIKTTKILSAIFELLLVYRWVDGWMDDKLEGGGRWVVEYIDG